MAARPSIVVNFLHTAECTGSVAASFERLTTMRETEAVYAVEDYLAVQKAGFW